MNTFVAMFPRPVAPTRAHRPGRQENARQLLVSAHLRLHNPSRPTTAVGACCCRKSNGPPTRLNVSTELRDRPRPQHPNQTTIPSTNKTDAQHPILYWIVTVSFMFDGLLAMTFLQYGRQYVQTRRYQNKNTHVRQITIFTKWFLLWRVTWNWHVFLA